MLSCRALSLEPMPLIKDVRVFDGSNFMVLDKFIIDFIDNHYHDIRDCETVINGIKCLRVNHEFFDEYQLSFNNKPELLIQVYYASDRFTPSDLKFSGHDIAYVDLDLPICSCDSLQTDEAYIVVNHANTDLLGEFDNGLDLIKSKLGDLLIRDGDILFMDELISRAGINKDFAYKMIGRACEFYIRNQLFSSACFYQ